MLSDILSKYPETDVSKRISNSTEMDDAKPFIQWVGGKREMIPQYKEYIPKSFNKYYEPFLGGGAMFFYLKPKVAVLGDNSEELIRAYEGVRSEPLIVIELLKELKNKHSKELYMEIRSVDRQTNIYKSFCDAEIASRFIYLNQTCFNGVYRVNKRGQFNVPIGSSLNRLICDEITIKKDCEVLKGAHIMNIDFSKLTEDARENDFIYIDPPYYPISIYSDFTRYTKEKFYKEDQLRLKDNIDELSQRGCKVMLSNSDCKFTNDLYTKYRRIKTYSNRTLNSKKDKRGRITELLILNY
jgi:DNA adenine methylase